MTITLNFKQALRVECPVTVVHAVLLAFPIDFLDCKLKASQALFLVGLTITYLWAWYLRCCGIWGIQYLDEVFGDVSPSNIKSSGQVWQGKALINRTDVGHAISRIHNNTGQKTLNSTNNNNIKNGKNNLLNIIRKRYSASWCWICMRYCEKQR